MASVLKWNEKVSNTAEKDVSLSDHEPMLTIAADGDFDGVARCIADPAPEWLPIVLAHFSQWIGGDTSDARVFDILDQLQRATKVLEQSLPAFTHMAFKAKCPQAVKLVLSGLPGLKAELERINHQRIGRKPDAQRQICAAVIIEAWQLIHGKAHGRDEKFYMACSEYWRVCGSNKIGFTDDTENWRSTVSQALKWDWGWLNERLVWISTTKWVESKSA
jgi:hypothetical protein